MGDVWLTRDGRAVTFGTIVGTNPKGWRMDGEGHWLLTCRSCGGERPNKTGASPDSSTSVDHLCGSCGQRTGDRPMITVTTENWQARANCRDVDPERMQPEVATRADVEDAKLVCHGCPVFDQCKALAKSQPGGAYGIHAGEWYGQFPRVLDAACEWCSQPIPDPDGANRATRRFCSDNCRKRAKRARQSAAALRVAS